MSNTGFWSRIRTSVFFSTTESPLWVQFINRQQTERPIVLFSSQNWQLSENAGPSGDQYVLDVVQYEVNFCQSELYSRFAGSSQSILFALCHPWVLWMNIIMFIARPAKVKNIRPTDGEKLLLINVLGSRRLTSAALFEVKNRQQFIEIK